MKGKAVAMIIDGEEYVSSNLFDVLSPRIGRLRHNSISATPEDARKAIESSARALAQWRRSRPSQRRDTLLKVVDILIRDSKRLSDLVDAIDHVKDIAGCISSTVEGAAPVVSDPDMKASILKEPYGVVFSVAACSLRGASGRSHKSFHEAGLPKGVVNFISIDHAQASQVTEAIISHPAVKKITFTGSVAVGKAIAELAGRYVKPVLLELGRQAPVIIWEDAGLDLAAAACHYAAFAYAGRCCRGTERILVHNSVRQAFEEKLHAAIKTDLKAEDDTRIMIRPGAVNRLKSMLKDAEAKGASLTSPTGRVKGTDNDASRLNPVVLSCVTPDMQIYKQENFAPTAILFEIDNEEEALRIANDTDTGLSASVFTKDLAQGFRLAEGIETGSVHINSMTIHDESALPHGGCKSSGFGRFNGSTGLSEWVLAKTITWKA
ncbi:aldehyde dehydrogenase domain-containing protein [Xylariaceae sp. FL0255]|nr:aldehyde dehydrogenase domain-containing protein [Xylariaceae sp. FL0255]